MSRVIERYINLLSCLAAARKPLLIEEIRQQVADYGQESYETFRRMFERDKDTLRNMGVSLELRPIDGWGFDEGYVLVEDSQLVDAGLTSEEHAALAVAMQMVHVAGGQVGEDGLFKLGGMPMLDAAPPQVADLGLDPEVLGDVLRAVRERRRLTFDYRGVRRITEPYGLAFLRGGCYLVAVEAEQERPKNFRISRIQEAEVGTKPEAFTRPPGVSLRNVERFGRWEEGPGKIQARVRWNPEAVWLAARRLPAGAEVIEMPDGGAVTEMTVGDPGLFLNWILGFGPLAEILEPAELRADFIAMVRGGQ